MGPAPTPPDPDVAEADRAGWGVPPLDGLRVLDFTRYLAGPFATMLLGDYGADVVKVESPKGREFGTAEGRDTYFFLSANRSKRSVVVDLDRPEGQELVRRIVGRFDVVVENFRPGVMEARGLGPERLRADHPRLVYCSISGFGATGPYAGRPGFDQIAQGLSGFMAVTGTEESGPVRAGIAIADLLAGVFAVQGIQLALLARERTGRGQVVDTSLLEAMVGVLSWSAGMFFTTGRHPGPAGHHHPLSSPYGRFRAADGYLNIAAGGPGMFRRLAEALGHPEWEHDERFATAPRRLAERAALTAAIEDVLATAPVATWVLRINEAGVPAGPVLGLDEVFADPQVLARDLLVELEHPQLGTFRTTGLPVKLAETPGRIRRRPPLLGEHTDLILGECGIEPAELDRLRAQGVIR
jgi:crotonobetainyl-CoA:carnitine CoA-transferase CaiB-like acyl-CoA transferase